MLPKLRLLHTFGLNVKCGQPWLYGIASVALVIAILTKPMN